jgi:cadmium resistance protein CadD (predicted permease)
MAIVSQALVAAAVYASTNIDDLLILAVFLADPRVRVGAVFAGRFLALGVLVLVSAVAALLAMAVPAAWIALLGFVPLALGLRLLPSLFGKGRAEATGGDVPAADAAPDQGRRGAIGQALMVAGVTLASGGDNLAVYIPLFATAPQAVVSYAAVFAVMTVVWCGLGFLVVNNPLFGQRIRKHGQVLMPVVLILLGLTILTGAVGLLRDRGPQENPGTADGGSMTAHGSMTNRAFMTAPAQPVAVPSFSGMFAALSLSQVRNVCNRGFSVRAIAGSRAAQKTALKSRLNWNMLPRSSAPGNPKLR